MKLLTCIIIGLFVLTSCEQEVYFDVPDGHTKIFAFSEITTDEKIVVEVNIAPGINTDDGIEFPKQSDARIALYENGELLTEPLFRFITRQKSFTSQGSFTPKAGLEYTLEVSLKNDPSIKPISATTVIPKAEILQDVQVRKMKEVQVNSDQKEFSLEVDVNFQDLDHNYYLLIPYYVVSEGIKEYLDVRKVLKGSRGGRISEAMQGVLVDREKLKGRLSLSLISESYVNVDTDLQDKIFLEARTITQEAHAYYKSLTKQVDAQNAVVSEPVITFTNFENGLGLFTGFASSISKLEF